MIDVLLYNSVSCLDDDLFAVMHDCLIYDQLVVCCDYTAR